MSKGYIKLTTKMTMTKDYSTQEPTTAFWLTHPDPTQAAVHLALQWIAYVYPASELQIDRTLKHALPYADADLSSRWSQFLDENDVEEHVEALEWIAKTLSAEQIPFLVETCWRLLLVDHELPTHVPLALRILARVLSIKETQVHELGESVFREYVDDDETRNRAPLLPVDPRYLDRVEWRLYGHSATQRLNNPSANRKSPRSYSLLIGFSWGTVFGAVVVLGLVFGPLQLGRVIVPIMSHNDALVSQDMSTESVSSAVTPEIVVANEATIETPVASSTIADRQDAPEELTLVSEPDVVQEESVISETVAGSPVSEPDTLETTVIVEPTTAAPSDADRVLMEVTATILNVRQAPNVDSDILIKLGVGARVWAYPGAAEGLWMMVKVEGETGFASARFLRELAN